MYMPICSTPTPVCSPTSIPMLILSDQGREGIDSLLIPNLKIYYCLYAQPSRLYAQPQQMYLSPTTHRHSVDEQNILLIDYNYAQPNTCMLTRNVPIYITFMMLTH